MQSVLRGYSILEVLAHLRHAAQKILIFKRSNTARQGLSTIILNTARRGKRYLII